MEIVLIVLAILVATGSFFYVYKQNKAYRAKWEELDAASEKLIQQSEIVRQKNEELEERLAATKELDVLQDELRVAKQNRDTINADILKRKEVEEQKDFYRVQLSDSDHNDIQVLNEVRPSLRKPEILNKFIYDNYVARPAKEMVKRVLQNRKICGIYKITYIPTGEVYIGRSVDVGVRWMTHLKTACGLEAAADSMFHRALARYGVDKFTWELLEECGKDEINAKEKYYIQFFDTTRFGFNQRIG